MPEAPAITVLLAAYNSAATIDAAIASIQAQTIEDWEMLVIDDASHDDTIDRVLRAANVDTRIRLIRNPGNLGLAGALNRGLEEARGEFVARQDADDSSLSDRFAVQMAFLLENPDFGAVGCQVQKVTPEGSTYLTKLPCDWNEIEGILPRANPFVHGSLLIRRSLLQEAGGYRPFFRYSQDYDLVLRLAEMTKLANLATCHYRFRWHPSSSSSQNAFIQRQYMLLAQHFASERATRQMDALGRGQPPEVARGSWLQRFRYNESYRCDNLAALHGHAGHRIRQLLFKAGSIVLCPWRLPILLRRRSRRIASR